MKKIAADPVREIDFTQATRGAVIPMEPGKTKISIRLDNAVIDYFRDQVDRAGGGNYQTLINDALVMFIQHEYGDSIHNSKWCEAQAASGRPAPKARCLICSPTPCSGPR
jgi:uncharacterized protein (DUF4415 family)